MRRWAALGEAERVGVYTRWSLYFVLAVFNGSVLLAAAPGGGETAALLVGGTVVTALGVAAMVPLLRSFPAVPPLPWARLAPLLVAAAAFAAVAVAAWEDEPRGAALSTVVGSVTLVLGLLPGRRIAAVLVVAGAVLFGAAGGSVGAVLAGAVMAGAFLFTGRASLWVLGIVTDLDAARQVQARLAVAEERLRFSRDVHDVLGRRLSTIAVQAELAATLAERGDPRAAERMLEVRGVAHEALREARDMARGYRATDFLKELDGARSLLRSAGIGLEASVEALPPGWHEAAAWIVREGITNVLRHSDAETVTVRFGGEELTVANDGARPGGEAADGTGLQGLRERLEPLGASLTAGVDGGDWRIVARLPGPGPLAARDRAPA